MKILILDNYDSFTYNLVHMVKELGYTSIEVHRNDQISLEEIDRFDKIILSPGPGIPEEAGILVPLIQRYAATKSILGICLGHQAIAIALGGKLTNLDEVFHGIQTPVEVSNDLLFHSLPTQTLAGRYHSWVINKTEHFPPQLEVIASDTNGHIMAVRHREYDVRGIQFHPESVMTPDGKTMLQNWLAAPLVTTIH